MEIVRTVAALRAARARQAGRTFGYVPTMGCLHRAHMALVDRARAENNAVGVSLFVNPAQFGPQEDYNRYPRTFAADCALCEQHGVDLLFAPAVEEMYPAGFATAVEVGRLGDVCEGVFRPGHFRGVATVVTKLLTQTLPDRAYFGEKDAQQLAVIRQLVRDLDLPVTVVGCPTVRETDGLACSSRNIYLTPDERRRAPRLFLTLQQVSAMLTEGQTCAAAEAAGQRQLAEAGFGPVDYLTVVDPVTFMPAAAGPRRIVVAAKLGSTRLIDNLLVE